MAGSVSFMSHVVSKEGRATGKRYAEVQVGGSLLMSTPGQFQIGVTRGNPPPGGAAGLTSDDGGVAWNGKGRIEQSNVILWSYAYADILLGDDVVCMAMDLDGGKLWITRNNDGWIGDGDPDAGTTPTATIVAGTWYVGTCAGANIGFGPETLPFYWPVTIRTKEEQFTRSVRPSTFTQFA